METVGIAEYNHKIGECYGRKIATLDGFCGDPRCRKALAARAKAYCQHCVWQTHPQMLTTYLPHLRGCDRCGNTGRELALVILPA